MKKFITSLIFLSIGGFLLVEPRPRYIECQDSMECGSFACCVIGTKYYSLPQCMPYLSSGERCSDGNYMSFNKTVTYPDNAKVMYTNVHLLQCPCEPGLSCGGADGVDGGDGYGRAGKGGVSKGGVGKGGNGEGAKRHASDFSSAVCYDPLLLDNLNSISNSVYDHY